ncbi:sulfite exporter TauE/SafE family protein [Butyrivibrio sp. AE2015]|uniref:sulfite exporter TauE/SafE family protein n=1 Tax=Butyrivibrio sp. AE2015 TaxID=1280663 RepID=UPI0003B4C9F5|nr:sulfite exporter TauE/SafE family protein [Butyrivibrio sp. AE2015]
MFFWILASLAAFYVKGLCGFANTLVFTSIMSFAVANIEISPVELILGLPTNLIISWKERRSIDLKVVVPLAIMVIIGSTVGAFLLKNTDVTVIKIIFGILVIFVGIEMLIRELAKKKSKNSKVLLIIIGILSGFLCGLYGVGALLGAYIGRTTENTRSFKANICTVFIIENTFRLGLYLFYGILTIDMLKKALLLSPFMLIGLGLGMYSAGKINEMVVKKIVIVLLILSGVVLIFTNVT